MSAELVCLGLATHDTIVAVPRWPQPDGRLVVESLARAGGGPAATAAVSAARLGHTVAFVGAIGSDPAGRAVRSGLAAERVDVDLVEEQDARSPESVILVDASAATRSILHAPGGARLRRLPQAAAAACRAAAWVHVDHAGWPLASALPRERLSVDAGNPIDGLRLAGLGLYAPTVAALRSRYPDRPLGAALTAALHEGARMVAVTLGSGGAVLADASGAWRAGGTAVPIRSTLGAGDVFHGALLAALLAGHPAPEALRRANAAAALSCRALDARTAIPRLDELETALPSSPPVEAVLLEDLA